MAFKGFPDETFEFFEGLTADNSKTYWQANKHIYDSCVAEPLRELFAELEPEFGEAKLFRPYRDVRFAKDKTPYKTHQGAFVPSGPSTGWYVQVGAPGVRVGVGFYEASPARLAAIRTAIAEERRGRQLARIIAKLQRDGWHLGGDTLKTSPRGYDPGQPRIELLRHRSMTLGRSYGFEPVIHTSKLLDLVRADWRASTPFVRWVTENAG